MAPRQREDAVEPVKRWIGGLKSHHGSEIIMSGIDSVAARQFFHHFRWTMAQAFTRHHDQCAGLRLDRVAGFDVGRTVAADNLPISATWENPAGEFWPMNGASENSDSP